MEKDKLETILQYIDRYIEKKISLQELADLIGYSPFYFSKLFTEAMGLSVTGYIRIRKLQYALVYLAEGEKVVDVSFRLAFDSHEGFTRSFTQVFGMNPSKAKKYLVSYKVPNYNIPKVDNGGTKMEERKSSLECNLSQMVFEVLGTSLDEAEEGFCNKIEMVLFQDGRIIISDDGRGIPLSGDEKKDQEILNRIFSGYPILNFQEVKINEVEDKGLKVVNSLCENLHICVRRNGYEFLQDFIRGIAQHKTIVSKTDQHSGTMLILKPDQTIFGEKRLSEDIIKKWIETEKKNRKRFPEISVMQK